MIGLALGLGARPYVGFTYAVTPSGSWNGTAGSGFGGSYGAIPSDPTRTTAKPAVRLLEPPYQRFTDELTVGVTAFALNGTTLIGGIEKVRFHFEGTTYDVSAPSFRTLTKEDGSTYSCLGYWVRLKKPTGTAGEAQLYAEAFPTDATMQNRVIGPYSFFPEATLHDWEATVGASGADYTDIRTALNAARSAAAENPLIELIDDGDYTLSTTDPLSYTPTCRTHIKAATGVSPRLTFAAPQAWRPRHLRMWVEGVEFDLTSMQQMRGEGSSDFVLKHCRFVRTGGRALWFRNTTNVSYFVDDGPWQLECYHFGSWELGDRSQLLRGCVSENVYGDYGDKVLCAVHNTCNDLSDRDTASQTDALTINYTGSGTATVSGTDSGGGTSIIRTFNFLVDAVSVGTFAAWRHWSRYDDGDNLYTVQDLVDYINTLTDWSATLIDNTMIAGAASDPNLAPGLSGNDFPTPIAVGAGLTLKTSLGLHQDGFVHPTGANENVIIYANTITQAEGQLAYTGGNNDAEDLFYINNLFEQIDGAGQISNVDQYTSGTSHVAFVHNTWSRQNVDINWAAITGDAYCLFSNNVADMIRGDIGDQTGENNHVQTDGSGSIATGLTNTVQAGTRATLYADADALDFTPAGELLSNLKTAVASLDINGTTRAASDAVGAIAS